jgi:hypothetical protein
MYRFSGNASLGLRFEDDCTHTSEGVRVHRGLQARVGERDQLVFRRSHL